MFDFPPEWAWVHPSLHQRCPNNVLLRSTYRQKPQGMRQRVNNGQTVFMMQGFSERWLWFFVWKGWGINGIPPKKSKSVIKTLVVYYSKPVFQQNFGGKCSVCNCLRMALAGAELPHRSIVIEHLHVSVPRSLNCWNVVFLCGFLLYPPEV